eukprot:5705-Heterococcus_DN1.PRE.2
MTTHHISIVIIQNKSSCRSVEAYVSVCCMNSTKLTCDVSAPLYMDMYSGTHSCMANATKHATVASAL